MRGFTESWLKEFQGKRQIPPASEISSIQFTLAKPTLLLNEILRMHFGARHRYQAKLSGEIAGLTRGIVMVAPFDKAIVTIQRFSVQEPDRDGLVGGMKHLIDCLLVRSGVHPHGLGFIADDDPAHMTLVAQHVKSPTLKGQATTVTIERTR